MTRAFACRIHGRPACWSILPLGLASTVWAGCALDAEPPDVGTSTAELAAAGPWQIPPDVRAAGDAAEVPYVGGGPWEGEVSCSGQLTEHAVALRELLLWAFPQITFISDYACRPIGASGTRTSVHGVGRALDLHIPTVAGGEADNELGDPVGNWLIENAQMLGVQYVIWDGWQWRSNLEPGAKDGLYGGSNPHCDHLHVEVTANPPELTDPESQVDTDAAGESCFRLSAAGGLLDELGPCVERHGPGEFWRLDENAGHDGSLYWTNAFTSEAASNWARYTLRFDEAGDYLLRAYVPESYGCFHAVRYEIRHAEGQATVTADQSASRGWIPLGVYLFGTGIDQWVDVFDDTLAEVDSERRVVVDALRVDRVSPFAAAVSTGQEAPTEHASSAPFTSVTRPVEAPTADEASATDSPAAPDPAPVEATRSAGSTNERAACTTSAGTRSGPPSAQGLGILLAWLLHHTRHWFRCHRRTGRDRWRLAGRSAGRDRRGEESA
jgi:hypothetical protein